MSDDAHNLKDAARVVAFSFGKNKFDAYPIQKTVSSFAEFAQFVCDHRSKKKGELYFCAPFAPNGDGRHHRGKEGVQPRRFLPLDLDYVEDQETLANLLLALQPWTHFTYTTASHTPQKPRVRGVIELSRAVTRTEGIRCGLAFQSKLLEAARISNGAVKFDKSVYRGEQPCFGPLTDAEVYPRDFQLSGTALDVDALLADAPEIATEVTAVDRAGQIIETDPRVRHLYDAGFVLKAKAPTGKLAIRCPNAAAHSSETSPTACVVLLPHFNGVAEAAIHCLHESCATLTQAEFWKLAGWSEAQGHDGADTVAIGDFLAYMPTHHYIFRPNGELWPAESVNNRLPPLKVKGREESDESIGVAR